MSKQTNIEWADSTFNPWMGCTKVSPACDHCYAERDTKRFGRVEWGAGKPRVRTADENWRKPVRWIDQPFVECMSCGWRGEQRACTTVRNPAGFHPPVENMKACPRCKELAIKEARRRVFCASLADWLDNEVPIEWLVDLLDLIRRTPNLDWLLLTKRIGNWRVRLPLAMGHARETGNEPLAIWITDWLQQLVVPANVWMLITVCDQPEADRDIPKLLRVPAVVRGLSVEPLLGVISLPLGRLAEWNKLAVGTGNDHAVASIDWVIVGGESGPHARPMHPDWVRSLRDQCSAAGVPFMVKQLSSGGAKPIKKLSDFPPDLRIRQFPEGSP